MVKQWSFRRLIWKQDSTIEILYRSPFSDLGQLHPGKKVIHRANERFDEFGSDISNRKYVNGR
jgi:hypothetical protein